MGPRSSDRGYGEYQVPDAQYLGCFNGSTVLRPWLWRLTMNVCETYILLQWVHGPQTVVMIVFFFLSGTISSASMGPRSSDRGYAP